MKTTLGGHSVTSERLKSYAYFVRTKPAFSYIKELYSIDDAISDAYLLSVEEPKEHWKKLLWKAIGRFKYNYIKSNPFRYNLYREYQNNYKREARENLDNSYIKDILRLENIELTGENIANKRSDILFYRNKGYRKLKGLIPPEPDNTILLKNLNGYEDFLGYAILNDRTKFYSCKGRGGKTNKAWRELKINNGCVVLTCLGKLRRLKLRDV